MTSTNDTSGDQLARSRFQSGLLSWLRSAAAQDSASGLREMIAVTRTLSTESQDGLLWRSASSFLQALLDGTLNANEEARTLCRRLERHLAGRSDVAGKTREKADELANAIFSFASNRQTSVGDNPTDNLNRPPIDAAMANALGATADILPLLANAQARRLDNQQQAEWKQHIARLRNDWHAVQTGELEDFRAATTALLGTALAINDAATLRFCEALAEAAGAAENPSVIAQAGFRAALSAALEIAEHSDGPDQKGFDDIATAAAKRLSTACTEGDVNRPNETSRWFAADANEILNELDAALEALPPKRLVLLSGFEWLTQQDGGKAMAIRGLASTAHRIIGLIRTDDLDQEDNHGTLRRCIEALRLAINELADGHPPRPDETVFAELRALEARIAEQRQQAIAAANKNMPLPPTSS